MKVLSLLFCSQCWQTLWNLGCLIEIWTFCLDRSPFLGYEHSASHGAWLGFEKFGSSSACLGSSTSSSKVLALGTPNLPLGILFRLLAQDRVKPFTSQGFSPWVQTLCFLWYTIGVQLVFRNAPMWSYFVCSRVWALNNAHPRVRILMRICLIGDQSLYVWELNSHMIPLCLPQSLSSWCLP